MNQKNICVAELVFKEQSPFNNIESLFVKNVINISTFYNTKWQRKLEIINTYPSFTIRAGYGCVLTTYLIKFQRHIKKYLMKKKLIPLLLQREIMGIPLKKLYKKKNL